MPGLGASCAPDAPGLREVATLTRMVPLPTGQRPLPGPCASCSFRAITLASGGRSGRVWHPWGSSFSSWIDFRWSQGPKTAPRSRNRGNPTEDRKVAGWRPSRRARVLCWACAPAAGQTPLALGKRTQSGTRRRRRRRRRRRGGGTRGTVSSKRGPNSTGWLGNILCIINYTTSTS